MQFRFFLVPTAISERDGAIARIDYITSERDDALSKVARLKALLLENGIEA